MGLLLPLGDVLFLRVKIDSVPERSFRFEFLLVKRMATSAGTLCFSTEEVGLGSSRICPKACLPFPGEVTGTHADGEITKPTLYLE